MKIGRIYLRDLVLDVFWILLSRSLGLYLICFRYIVIYVFCLVCVKWNSMNHSASQEKLLFWCCWINFSLPRKTFQQCINQECLEYINALGPDEENQENLTWHVCLLLGQIRALYELDIYHKSYPWKSILALDPSKWSLLLVDMQKTWKFVLEVVDPLPMNSRLSIHLLFTKYQPFRDLMTKAEYLSQW